LEGENREQRTQNLEGGTRDKDVDDESLQRLIVEMEELRRENDRYKQSQSCETAAAAAVIQQISDTTCSESNAADSKLDSTVESKPDNFVDSRLDVNTDDKPDSIAGNLSGTSATKGEAKGGKSAGKNSGKGKSKGKGKGRGRGRGSIDPQWSFLKQKPSVQTKPVFWDKINPVKINEAEFSIWKGIASQEAKVLFDDVMADQEFLHAFDCAPRKKSVRKAEGLWDHSCTAASICSTNRSGHCGPGWVDLQHRLCPLKKNDMLRRPSLARRRI